MTERGSLRARRLSSLEREEKKTGLAGLRRRACWQGVESMSDEELLTLLLNRKETKAARGLEPRQLLEGVGGLEQMRKLRPHALHERGLLDEDEAFRLVAALELGARSGRDALVPPPCQPLSFEAVVGWARPRLAGLEHEEVWVLCVNGHSALRSAWQVGRGGMHGCGLLARDLLVPVVRDGASGFILVHNHPSGDPTPSPEDIDLTRGIQLAGTSLCIPLLDHVVVARSGARSFFELGYLDR